MADREKDRNSTLSALRRLARKYKAMNLPVQRRSVIDDYLFWRRMGRY